MIANIKRYAMRNIKLKPMAQTLQKIRELAESMWEGCHGCDETDKQMWINGFVTGYLMSTPIEKEQRIKDYNAGYTDAQCNHINDADNYANEIEYLRSRINEIDDEIKRREDKIADLLINGETYKKD